MKKIYFSLLLVAGALQISNAQLSLTKAFNEPVVGDLNNIQFYDSTTAIPKATGAGMNWSFLSLTSNTMTQLSTYTTVASTPSASTFPGSTLAENQGGGNYQFYKITPTTYEVSGLQFPSAVINFSNTAVFATWPVGFGYNAGDSFAGSTTTGTITTSIAGSLNINAAGTGTVVMPGGLVLTNCLQLVNSINLVLAQNTYTQAQVQKEYNYYHSSNKFAVLTVKYSTVTSGTVVSKTYEVHVNTAIVAGLTTHEIENNLTVYPNPASEKINVSLTNNTNQNVSVNITNMLGQIVKTENLGNESEIHSNLNVNELPKGIYLMTIFIGQTSSVKKIVVE